jgi:hypothetical protein
VALTGAFALPVAALASGMFSGAVLAAIYTHAKVSLAQEWMQRIVRYWQAEARRRRAEAECGSAAAARRCQPAYGSLGRLR